ncbi:MAG TPA: hypothetical protein VGM02_09470 [Acidobacteriaceae bacterium]|jgi:hypothetical protein
MKQRIAMWSVAGFLVSGCWVILTFLTSPMTFAKPAVRILAIIVQPIALVSFRFHVPMHFLEVMIANAATYGLIGLMVETLRRSLHHAR